jgi:DNA processing protein
MSDHRLRFDLDDQRLVRAAWSRLVEPTDAAAQRLVAQFGAAPALARVVSGSGPPRWRVRLAELDPAVDLERAEQHGARLIIPSDDEWPPGLDALGESRPFCLWVRGPLSLNTVTARCTAIVGAREASGYGLRITKDLAAGCADQGVAVVSGAAFGIDAAAHQGALNCDGSTIAVLACGVERAYPRGNDQLITRIAAKGCVVSEVPPGTMPTRWRFLERNRLIAALSQLVVVVEAGHRSGALGTAARAAQLGITVAAVPGPVTSPSSYGAHRLLREGAVCVTSADEVIELLDPIGSSMAELPPVPAAVHDGLSASDLRVFDALPLRHGAAVPSLSRVAGLEQGVVEAALGRLELSGLAEREGADWRKNLTRRR